MGVVSTPGATLPPPARQLSAVCNSPTYASDQLICNDPNLLAVDHQMLASLRAAGRMAIEPTSPFVEAQEDWVRRRSLCALRSDHAICLEHAYDERVEVLRGLSGDSVGPSVEFYCPSSDGVEAMNAIVQANGTTLLYEHGRLIGVGTPQLADNRWQPYLAVDVSRQSQIVLHLPGRRSRRCDKGASSPDARK
jgi:uncharacterized protein